MGEQVAARFKEINLVKRMKYIRKAGCRRFMEIRKLVVMNDWQQSGAP